MAWQTVRELTAVAAGEQEGFRRGRVAVVRTFGDQLDLHPHVHVLVTRGAWTADGNWLPIPCVNASAAGERSRYMVIRLLQREWTQLTRAVLVLVGLGNRSLYNRAHPP